MILRRTYRIETAAKLDCALRFSFGKLDTVLRKEEGNETLLVLERSIQPEDLDIPQSVPQPTGGAIKAHFLFPSLRDKSIHEEFEEATAFLEAYLFQHGVLRIDRDDVKVELIPSDEAEDRQLRKPFLIKKMALGRQKLSLMEITKDWMDPELLPVAYHLREFLVPYSLFRRAFLAMEDDDFPIAFLSCFLMIEGFYGQGKHENLEDIFRNQQELVAIVQQMLESDLAVAKAFNDFPGPKFPSTAEGVFKTMIVARGHASHYSVGKSRPYITAANRRDYADLAYAMMKIAGVILDTQIRKTAMREGIPILPRRSKTNFTIPS